ncbi:MAG TPA: preprotein translocase subunit SecE [Sutterella sp.]|nr:preprotein translocase subunit SecE [Sutterella sp.]
MNNQNAKAEEKGKTFDTMLVTLAAVLALCAVCGFSLLSEETMLVRLGCLLGGLVAAVVVAWLSPSGKRFIAYGADSWTELRRVIWPSRKETMTSTGVVLAVVVSVALFLFLIDQIIEWGLYDVLLAMGQ